MIALLLFGLLACASAAPRHYHHHPPPFDHQHLHGGLDFNEFLNDEIFDTRRFWEELRREMLNLDETIADLRRRFPSITSNAAVEGNEYKVTIPLEGFTEKDIVVKAKSHLLMVQAVHNIDDISQKSSLYMYTLPDNVEPTGSWTFSNSILKIVFPIKGKVPETKDEAPEPTTVAPDHSREDMDKNNDSNQDADVGLNRGDLGDPEVLTNEIRRGREQVEATTYAVDLKEEVEFVPISYKKGQY